MSVWRFISTEKMAEQSGDSLESAGEPMTLTGFAALVDRHQRELHSFVAGLVSERELARDLMQDAFHDAWRAALAGVRPFTAATPDDEQRRWLFTVAYRKAISALRRRKLIRWESLDAAQRWGQAQDGAVYSEEADPSSFEDRLAEGEAIRAALAQLSPADVACLLLRIVQGFSASEVAAIVGATPEAVAKRLSRARQRLRAAYRAQEGEEYRAEASAEASDASAGATSHTRATQAPTHTNVSTDANKEARR